MKRILFLLCCLYCALVGRVQEVPRSVTITLNEKDAGRKFEGIGGVSAGASSELLIDYAEPYRARVLDYLFKPKFGAALQQLKVEIGADAVVVGAEASHARTLQELRYPRKEYYERGYEFWLMKEAQKRNPEMIFCALEWAIPAYLTGHWTKENAEYIAQFIKGAKQYWDIDMQYISPGKNESPIIADWLKNTFWPTLVKKGLSNVKILAPDDLGRYWEFCEELKNDSVLSSLVSAVGYHYVYNHLPQLNHESNAATETAKGLNKISLWASEDWSMYDGTWKNAHVLAGILNKMYIRDRITAMQIWDPVDGYYDNTGEWKSTGLLQADQPWSGYYNVWPAIWATAHFTQFTEPGWRYIDSGCGYFDKPSGSNYTSLYNPLTHDFSTIIYTDTSEQRTRLRINLEAGLSKPVVYIWRSDKAEQFQMIEKQQVKNNAVEFEVLPGSIYTISSTTGQQKGSFPDEIKAPSAFLFPYHENFDSVAIGKNPRFFADIEGAFEVVRDIATKNKCLEQQIVTAPVNWTYYSAFQPAAGPLTELGDLSWDDYAVSVDVQLPAKGFAQIIARMNKLPGYTEGYTLKLHHNGYWELLLNSYIPLAAGKIDRNLRGWHNLKLICNGPTISVVIDEAIKKLVNNNLVKSGMVGLGSSWDKVRFDNLKIFQVSGAKKKWETTSGSINGVDTANRSKVLSLFIDLNDEKQTMHSFGASDAWNMKFIGKNWPVEKRNKLADLLFSQEFDKHGNPKGIGLSLWRFFIGAGSQEQGINSGIEREYRREECFLKADGTYDWSKQQGQQWFLKAARDRGVKYLLGFTCSPPVYMTRNGKAHGSGGSELGKLNLAPGKYADFAGFLAEVIKHFNSTGLKIDYISPFNEPQWDWVPSNPITEGSGAQNAEIFGAIDRLNSQFAEAKLSTKIVFGECAAHPYLYKTIPDNPGRSDVINYFWNPSGAQYLGNFANVEKAISGHSYFSNGTVEELVSNRLKLRQKISEADAGLNFWQTEYCILGDEGGMQGEGRDLGMAPALHIARVIHDDIVLANAASWQWWLSVSPSDYKDGLLYITDMDGRMGELETTKHDGIIQESKMFWVFGNFSLFVKPGMVRIKSFIESFADPLVANTQLMASAYKDSRQRKLVVVLINMTNEEQKLSFPSNLKLGDKRIKTYTTNSKENLEFALLNSADTITLEGRSVMTLLVDF